MKAASEKKYDVGILGWWYGKNYGSILTYYGLNKAIGRLGYDVLMVHEPMGYDSWRVKWPENIVSIDFAKRAGYNYTEQQHYSKLPALNARVGAFVVGSDQLWNPLIGRVNDDLFLDFVGPENKRIAYATSFGNRDAKKFKPDFVARHSRNLKQFDAISVREEYAVATARQVFDVEATQVLDPVFLLSRQEYEDLADRATTKVSGDYLAVFFLDPTPEKKRVAEAIADKLGLKTIVVVPNPSDGREPTRKLFKESRFEVLREDSPENFLHTYRNAQYVVTDSFHGSAFAVIFGRPFSSIYNTKRGVDRFKNLMKSLGFGETRRVHETDGPAEIAGNRHVARDVDFTKANRHIETEREISLNWLKAALALPKQAAAGPGDAETPPAGTQPQIRPAGDSAGLVGKPGFTASNAAWRIAALKDATELSVTPGMSLRGNVVWCDLPVVLRKQQAYRLTIDWTLRSTRPAVNLHIRNPGTGKFHVIGNVATAGRSAARRRDMVEFVAPNDGFTQFMLGAIHFEGKHAGAEIAGIAVEEIPAVAATAPQQKLPTHAGKALELALKDNDRFVNFYAPGAAARGISSARARLMFHSHAIEKGLSRSDFRPGFGKIAVPSLAREMNGWIAAGRKADDPFFRIAASVMQAYFDRHSRVRADVSEFRKLFNAAILDLIAKADDRQGGVVTADAVREARIEANQDRRFLDVVYGRRSVREFTAKPVRDEEIRAAVQIAMQAPSVCNRQAARVHQFEDSAVIQAALDLQGGFSGYKMPPRLLLVTCDLASFLFAAERNQAFIDGGLFMMTLLLGLEQMGIGSCCLNTAMSAEREAAIRKILKVPESEVFIAFVAAGHFDPKILTPQSKRMAVDEVLVRHTRAKAYS